MTAISFSANKMRSTGRVRVRDHAPKQVAETKNKIHLPMNYTLAQTNEIVNLIIRLKNRLSRYDINFEKEVVILGQLAAAFHHPLFTNIDCFQVAMSYSCIRKLNAANALEKNPGRTPFIRRLGDGKPHDFVIFVYQDYEDQMRKLSSEFVTGLNLPAPASALIRCPVTAIPEQYKGFFI